MAISHEAGPALEVLPPPPTPTTLIFARPRRASVSRGALVQRIESGALGKLTLLVAPAGWGKTSLLAEWMATTAQPVAWLPLEARDNDPSRLLRLLGTAINQAHPGLADDVISALRSPYSPSIDDLIAMLVDSIRLSASSFVLVLDDVQHLTSPEVRQILHLLVTQTPESVRLVLGGRADPPLNLSRLRVLGEVTELRADDLRFGADEAGMLFSRFPNVDIDTAAIGAIVDRTEGWAAGIQIAALTLRGGNVDPAQIVDLRGTQREVAGFLCEEVFSCQSADMKQFLLQASVFEKISGPMGDAALQRTDSQSMLERATNENLFVIPCNCGQNMYRIHQLFRDYLRSELQRQDPTLEKELHRRAATWLIENDQVMEAIEYLIAAGETERSIDLIDRMSTNMVLTSEHTNTFLRWVELFPRDVVASKPRMLRFYVQALTLTGRLADAESLVDLMIGHPFYRDDPADPANNRRQAEMLAVQSRISAYRGDNARTVDLAERALSRLGSSDKAWQASLHLDLGWAWRSLGRLDQAADRFASASRLGWESGSLQPALWGTRYLALSWVAQGRLREAISLIDADLERAAGTGADIESVQACLLISRGELLHEQYRLPEARVALERGVDLATRNSDAKILMNGFVALGLLEQAEGKPESAMLMLRRGTRIFAGAQEVALQASLALSAGQLASAVRWAEASGLSADDDLVPKRGPAEQVTFARVLLATGKSDRAVALLERLLAQTSARGWHGRTIELRAQLALALFRSGDRERALATLAAALDLAAPEGFVREFVEAGPDMIGLLRDVMRSRLRVDRGFVSRLIALKPPPDTAMSEVTRADLPEALTDRQLDVLRLLAAGRSNRLIAEELFLAEGTVKAHVHQISAKLLARNRTEAVARARSLGLLS